MIALKTERELGIIEKNARLLSEILVEVALAAQPGVSTGQLDRLAERLIKEAGAKPAFKGYQGYPATLCVSVDDEIVHGIPSDRRILAEGAVVSLDLGLIKDGYDFKQRLPLGRMGQPDEVARMVLVLASDLAAYVTGAVVPVDGGFLSA